jgi:hypothetical protein
MAPISSLPTCAEMTHSCRLGPVVIAYEVFDGPDLVRQLLGEGQSVPDETGDALPHRVVEMLDVAGFPRLLRDGLMLAAGMIPV